MANPNLQKVIKLTQSQYDILANGGTVGDFTGLNDNYLYLIQEDYEFPTTTTARKILMSTSTAGLVSWESLTANDIPSLDASKINSGIFNTSRIPNLNASKITGGTFDIARIPTGTTASTVALGNHNHDSVYLGINAAATSANKLNTNAGSAINPVYFANGIPVACTYSLNKTVPADAVFTDHTYNFAGTTFNSGNSGNCEHNANDAVDNGHYYYNSNGPSGLGEQYTDGALYVQSYSSNWVAQIAQDYRNGRLFVRGKNNGSWTSWQRVALTGEAQPASDVYAWAKAATKPSYTYSEVGAAAASHTHTKSQITDFPTSMPASDVYAWAKAANKPSYTLDEVSDGSTRKLANYLLKSGGTMTGKLQVNALIFGYNYTNSNNRAAFMFDKPGSNYTGIGAHAEANTIYFGACNADGDWVDSFKQIWKFNGTIIEDGTSLADKYLGISATAANSDKLNGQAASYYAPKAWVSENYLGISAKAADADKLDGQDGTYYLNYNNLTNKPTIPSVSNATITIKQTGISDQTFTLNGSATTITLADTNTWRPLGTGANDAAAGNHNHNGTYQSSSDILTAIDDYMTEAFLDGNFGFIKLVDDGHGNPAFIIDTTTYLSINAQAKDSAKLNGQEASYYLNYNNLTNKPTIPSVSNATITIKQTGISDQTFTLNGSAVTINLVDTNTWRPLGTGANDAAAGNHTHTLSITSGGSSPITLAANTTYTLTAGGSTLVFKTPPAGGSAGYYANQYNQYYYFSNSYNPNISSKIGLTSLTTYNYANLFFGFNSVPTDGATSLSTGHNITTSSKYFIMDFALASGYMSQLVFGTIGYDINKIYSRNMNAWGGSVGEPDDVSYLGTLYLEASSLYGTTVVSNTRYEFAIGRKNHCIHFHSGSNHAFFNILNNDFYTYSTVSQIASALYNAGHRSLTSFLRASGIYGSYTKPVVGVYATSGSMIYIMYMDGTTQKSTSYSSGTVVDSEINTVYEP